MTDRDPDYQADKNRPAKDTSQKIGKWMYYAAWICAMLVFYLFFEDRLAEQYNPNSQPDSYINQSGSNEVKLKRNRYGHYVANGLINGHSVTFMLDTGATHVAVPAHIAERIGLQKGQKARVNTANGQVEVYQTRLQSLSLGSIELHNISGNINPYMDRDEILLGMSALKRVEFSQKANILTLKQY